MADQAFLQFIDLISDTFDDNPYHAQSLLEELLVWLNNQPKYARYLDKTKVILDAFKKSLPSITLGQREYALAYQSNFEVILHLSEPMDELRIHLNGHIYHPTIVDEDRVFFDFLYLEPGTYSLEIFQNDQRLDKQTITTKSLIEMDDLGL
jgi:hypothetical protein